MNWIKIKDHLTYQSWEYGVFEEKEDMSDKGKGLYKVYEAENGVTVSRP